MAASFVVVEDHPFVGRALARKLSVHGETILCSTFAQGRAVLERGPYAGLLVDVNLPDGNGLDLAALARQDGLARETLVLSGAADHDVLSRSHRLGFSFLLKPADGTSLDLFASRALGGLEARIEPLLAEWSFAYRLRPALTAILRLAILGTPRGEIAQARGVVPATVKKQVKKLLRATNDRSLEIAVSRFLRELLERRDAIPSG